MKRTYQPSKIVRKRRHGFRARMATTGGRKVLTARRSRGRKRLSAYLFPRCSAVNKEMNKPKQILRLRKRAEFLALRNGEKRRGPLFLLEVRERTEEESQTAKIGEKPRAGFTVTKKNGNAVIRNRIRRRLREAVRCHAGRDMAPSTDYVIVAREQAPHCALFATDRRTLPPHQGEG